MNVKYLFASATALGALAVPAAQAMPIAGDDGVVGAAPAYVPFASDFGSPQPASAKAGIAAASNVRPDDRAGARAPDGGLVLRRDGSKAVASPIPAQESTDGTNWKVVGAGSGSALLILLVGSAALVLRRRPPTTALGA